jgi:hypothetical protein
MASAAMICWALARRGNDEKSFVTGFRGGLVCWCDVCHCWANIASMGTFCDWWHGMDAVAYLDTRTGAQLEVDTNKRINFLAGQI